MNVGQLRKFLEDVGDHLPVVVPSYDHSYEHTGVHTDKAVEYGDRTLSEYFGAEHIADELLPVTILDVIVIG